MPETTDEVDKQVEYQVGDIVQIIDESHHWFPCLIIVTEPKTWGVQGYMTLVKARDEPNGNAFIRLRNEQVELVGKAAIIRD